jgi:hypothetical protein
MRPAQRRLVPDPQTRGSHPSKYPSALSAEHSMSATAGTVVHHIQYCFNVRWHPDNRKNNKMKNNTHLHSMLGIEPNLGYCRGTLAVKFKGF